MFRFFAAILVLLFALVSCSSQSDVTASDDTEPSPYGTTVKENVSSTAVEEEDAGEPTSISSEEIQEFGITDAESHVVQEPVDGIQSVSSSEDGDHQPHPAPNAPQKHWVEDTERVWVEDSAAWTEQVPICSTTEVSICNVCGADVTGNATAHGKVHMLAGEGSGHHSEVRQTIAGYNTIQHEATGHWESRVIGGHWK